MFDIEKQHHDNVADLHRLAGLALGNTDDVVRQIEIGMMTQEIEKAIDKAKLYDLMKKYVCTVCDWVYDPDKGDPDSGILPGTPFEEIPYDWVCPLCGVGKDDFEVQKE